MMTFFYIFSMITLILFLLRNLRNRHIQTKCKYSLYALRDELRMKALNNELNKDSWLFGFFDHSLSYNIKDSYFITFFSMLLKIVRYENDNDYIKFRAKLNTALEDNPEFMYIQEKYTKMLMAYMLEQHRVSVTVLKPFVIPFVGISQLAVKLKTWINKTIVHRDSQDYQQSMNFSA